MSKLQILIIFNLCLISFTIFSQNKRYYLEQVVSDTEGPETCYLYTKLLKFKIEEGSGIEVFMPERRDFLNKKPNLDSSYQNASRMKCESLIITDISRIQGTYFINVSYYNTQKREKYWSKNFKATSAEGIETAFKETDLRINNDKDANTALVNEKNLPMNSTFSKTGYFGLKLGGFVPFFTNNAGVVAGGGINGMFDMRKLLFEIGGEIYYSANNTFLYFLKTEMMLPFVQKPNSVYASIGLNLGGQGLVKKYTSKVSNDPENSFVLNAGLIPHVGFGYIFGRGSQLPIRIDARMYIPTYTIENVYPMGAGLNVGIYF
ncbi:MAG: hypothetical protein SFY32_15710 [Bacteroidota bacterium]|nr:hypothetical protein [Bacteroidota bacterium]